MLGEEEVVVLDVKPIDLHGVIYRDVTVTFPDRSTKIVNMIVSLRRP